jgi:flagellar biosynthesis chaperone FliJ
VAEFRYRLQVLLDQKVRDKEKAQQVLTNARQQLLVAEAELRACQNAMLAADERLSGAQEQIASPDVIRGSKVELLRVRRDYILRLKDERDRASDATAAQEVAVDEVEERLAAARAQLASASRDVEVLEKHRARLERRFNEELMRKEALEQEEMANVIFLRRKAS